MRRPGAPARRRLAGSATVIALAVLSGCATVDIERSLARTNAEAAGFTDGHLALARTDAQREERKQVASGLLASPLGQREAVQLALANSPALQSMLAQNWSEASSAAAMGRIPNPILGLERVRVGDDLELTRFLSFGLLDLLLLPQRHGLAQRRIEEAQLRQTADVVDQVTLVRQAWVRAVAARQSLAYARQVVDSAEASAELARRMQAVGNFNRLARARQQAFYADAATQLATADHAATAAREELVRLLGLSDEQAAALRLPERLPDLPAAPLQPDAVAQAASSGRVDLRLAQAALETAGRAQGLGRIAAFTDIELEVSRITERDLADGDRTRGRGYEIAVVLPVFDWGGPLRDAMNAQTLAAANRLEATRRAAGSGLREAYSAYRTTYDIARHHRDEVVPLRKMISEENLLRYNAMLTGVFELLADSRDQVASVMAAIAAGQQFWLADAALQASIIGRPAAAAVANVGGGGSGAAAAAADPH
jgi:outer membrane protein TolC